MNKKIKFCSVGWNQTRKLPETISYFIPDGATHIGKETPPIPRLNSIFQPLIYHKHCLLIIIDAYFK